MAVGISNLPTGVSTITSAITSAANLLFVSPQQTVGYQPQPPPGGPQQSAIVFHYEGEQTSTLESDITDHFIEDNTAIQDQISLKPIIITTHGFVGELNDVAPLGLQTLQQAAQKLVAIGAYTPGLSATALLAYNEAAFAYQTATSAASSVVASWNTLNNSGAGGENVINGNSNVSQANPFVGTKQGSQTIQQQYYQNFYSYWITRTLFTIQTPWAIFQNMAIRTIRAIQDAETNTITDFEISFKQMRFADTQSILDGTVVDSSNTQGQLQYQSQSAVSNGTQPMNIPSSTTLTSMLA
jgi:hypothetical protein